MQRTFWSGQNIRERLDIVISRHTGKPKVMIHLTETDEQDLTTIIAEDRDVGLQTAPLMRHSYRNVHRITTPEPRSFVSYLTGGGRAKSYLDVDVLEEAWPA
jgi:hypothetical protein